MLPSLSQKRTAAPARDMALIVTDQLVEQVPVVALTAEYVSTSAGDFPREETCELIRQTGGRLFLVHCSLSARVEADQVRRLRRNALLQGLFHNQAGPDVNRIPLPFWLLVGGLVLGIIIVGAVN